MWCWHFFFPGKFHHFSRPPLWLLVSLREVNKCTGVGCYSLPLLPCRAADSPLLSLSRLRRPFGNTSFLCGWVGTPTAFFHSPFHAVMKCASCSCEGILKGILCQCVSGWKSPAQRLPAKQTILTLSRPQQGGVGGGGRQIDRQINSRLTVEINTPTGSDWGGTTDGEAPLNYVTEKEKVLCLFVLLFLIKSVTHYVSLVKVASRPDTKRCVQNTRWAIISTDCIFFYF